MTEDEMVRWHHKLNGLEFEQTLGNGEGQGSLVCCSPWGHKESNMTQQLNNNNEQLLYNVILISAVQQSEPAIWTHILLPLKPPFHPTPSHHPKSSQTTEFHCYRVTSHSLSVLHMAVYICQCYSPSLSHPPIPFLCSHVHSLYACLYSCPANREICTNFLDFIHML